MIDKALLKMAKERIQTQEEELETLKGECVVGTGYFLRSIIGNRLLFTILFAQPLNLHLSL